MSSQSSASSSSSSSPSYASSCAGKRRDPEIDVENDKGGSAVDSCRDAKKARFAPNPEELPENDICAEVGPSAQTRLTVPGDIERRFRRLPTNDQTSIWKLWEGFARLETPVAKNMFLEGLLTQCCWKQLSYVSAVKPLLRIDIVSLAPTEIAFKILSYLDAISLCHAAMVSRRWRRIADDDQIWRRMCEQHIDKKCAKCGWGLPLLEPRRRPSLLLSPSRQPLQPSTDQKAQQATAAQPQSAQSHSSSPTIASASFGHNANVFSPVPPSGNANTSSASSFDPCSEGADYFAQPPSAPPVTSSALESSAIWMQTATSFSLSSPVLGSTSSSLPSSSSSSSSSSSASAATAAAAPNSNEQVSQSSLAVEMPPVIGAEEAVAMDAAASPSFAVYASPMSPMRMPHNNGSIPIEQQQGGNLSEGDKGKQQQEQQQHLQQPQPPVPKAKTCKSWKNIYSERMIVARNWRRGSCFVRTLTGHTDSITCLQFDDKRIVTGSRDNTIKIWDIDSGECLKTLKGHTRSVRCLQFDERKIISGCMDRTIKIWCVDTGACVRTLVGHSEGVLSLNFNEKVLVSGSADCTIKVWCLDRREYFTLTGHKDCVNSVELYKSDMLLSASEDTTIKLWCLNARQCIYTFEGHVHEVQCIRADPCHGMLVSGSLDNTLKVWDTEKRECIRTLFGHVEGVCCLKLDSLRIVSGARDKRINIWDRQSGKLLHSIQNAHCGPISALWLSETKIVTGSEDSTVKIWDYGVSKCDGDLQSKKQERF